MRHVLVLLSVAALLLAGNSCNKKDAREISYEVLNQYITGYTGGTVSRLSDIDLQFVRDQAASLSRKALNEDWIEIRPDHAGRLEWKDDHTLTFKPEKPLQSGQEYEVIWKLSEMLDTKPDDFVCHLQTPEQQLEFEASGVKTTSGESLTISGSGSFADYVDAGKLEELVKAEVDGETAAIDIATETGEQYINRFSWKIRSLKRKASKRLVHINWDGAPLGFSDEGEWKLNIPARDEFKVMQVKIHEDEERYLAIWFSDPIRKNQNLNGLITLSDVDVKYTVDGNMVKVYPDLDNFQPLTLNITRGVRNTDGKVFKGGYSKQVFFFSPKPDLRLVREGVVLPSSENGLLMPFETVNLAAVDVFITKIYENNIHQFLQVNDMGGDQQLRRVGKGVVRKTVKLGEVQDYGQWTRHHLKLNELIDVEEGAIYRVALGFRKPLSVYDCYEGEERAENIPETFSTPEEDDPYWTIYKDGYFPYSYRYVDNYWNEKENPCHEAYYRAMRPEAQNLLATDMGMLAQRTRSGEMQVLVTDLKSARPRSGIAVTLYDYQKQEIAASTTNNNGIVRFPQGKEAFMAVAKKGREKSYLKLGAGTQQNLSNYDIGGKEVQDGLKGFIYGERGVWRPGDSIYVTFVLQEAPGHVLPGDHPVVLKFYSPRGDRVSKKVQTKSSHGFHVFRLHTQRSAPTGRWRVKVEAGGATFTKSLRVETVKPNRLKINLDFEDDVLVEGLRTEGNLKAKWLHGATAPELRADVELSLSETSEHFQQYPEMIFSDRYLDYSPQTYTVFDGKTNEQGKAQIVTDIDASEKAPGVMKGYFFTKVYEPGGNFSVNQKEVIYHPYQSYIGFKKPESDNRRGMLLTDKDYTIDLQSVNYQGKPVADRLIRAELYRLDWRWWWETDYSGYNYASKLQENLFKEEHIRTNSEGKAKWAFHVDQSDWGRYLLRFKDPQTGHVASEELYFSYPGWWRDLHSNFPGAAARLSLSMEEDRYEVGETGTAVFPGGENARAFITIENGSNVLHTEWIDATAEKNRYDFEVTEAMVPNIYVHVNLLQPHSNTQNDLPIRMYGIVPAAVEKPETHLHPQLSMPDELETGKPFTIEVSEGDNREMTYTLAVVDEGLLDLTNFRTPDPWSSFFAKEALGVETWDMYDWVIGALGGKIGSEVQIGGGARLQGEGSRKANRFKPVVKFLGPFTLSGNKNEHRLTIDDYIGSVRTMVIAGKDHAYGHAEKATPVTKPLMVLGTAPRVLGPGENVQIPVSIFVNKEGINSVNVQLEVNDLLKISGKTKKTLRVSETGELETTFNLTVKKQTGIAEIGVTAQSGNYQANYAVELDVRNPNPYVTKATDEVLENGEIMSEKVKAIGIPGTNSASLEVSTLPALNLEHRLDYLMRYPHGCVEQVVSSVFPQLYLGALTGLSDEEKARTERNVKAAINRLRAFQDNDGGMTYWPGRSQISEWGTNYAGHFLVEAQKHGYSIPGDMLESWSDYQTRKARRWVSGAEHEAYTQAYRLYTLALHGKTLSGPMNRLRNNEDLNKQGKWRLAAAYALAGKQRASENLIDDIDRQISAYRQLGRTYGSALRDKAMILETLLLLRRTSEAFQVLREIAKALSDQRWLSTQETAYSLMTAAKYAGQLQGNPMSFTYRVNGERKSMETSKAIEVISLPLKANEQVDLQVDNHSDQVLYTRIISRGKPAIGEETSNENGIGMKTKYLLPGGDEVDPASLEQGTDFYAAVRVTNQHPSRDYEEIILSQVFPSGWEIINQRMFQTGSTDFSNSSHDYRDIRDDRVYTYFDIRSEESKTFYVLLNASYAGSFYMPAVSAEAMYDNSIYGRKKGFEVEVKP